jgi:hypothetical protein
MDMALRSRLCGLLLCLFAATGALAQPAPLPFDLAGPVLRVTVTHDGVSLPISEVPNLTVGDQVSIVADLPPDQSAHYVLVAAFLRGATDPPPRSWFHRARTWERKGRDGLNVVVPPGAQQVVVFLAPETGGDFDTLVDAVRGRPGAFVRASQDLNQASLDRSRLDAFLAAVRAANPADPDQLKTVSPMLARSLTIKLNTDCFQKAPELQAACLMQGRDALVLNDGHSVSIVDALTSGPAADLVLQLSATQEADYGHYSPYLAAVMDIGRILESFHTAQYQYIPALPTQRDEGLALLLNNPPSFHNPLSVLVTALPAVEPPQAPPLQPVDPKAAYCVERTDLVLPVDGAPLVYSTHYAHDMALRVKDTSGQTLDLPVRADAEKGGFIADTKGFDANQFGPVIDGDLHGFWGFSPFDGPGFQLQNAHAAPWRLEADDEQSLIVGRDDTVRLDGPEAACVQSVSLQLPAGEVQAVSWTALESNRLAVTLPLANAQPGPISLLVQQYGMQSPDTISLQAFSQAARLDSFSFHAGDLYAVLKGSRLDEVARATLDGIELKPGALTTAGGGDELRLDAADPPALGKLTTGRAAVAKVTLKDRRTVVLKLTVAPPRPQVALIDKSISTPVPSGRLAIHLADADELPQDAQLTFSIRAQPPIRFTGREAVEVETVDGSASTTLNAAGGLVLEDAQVAVATLDPVKAFGLSAYGPLQFRIVEDGDPGDWRPLATLVRLPVLREMKCADGPGRPCELTGADLFLIDEVSNDPSFDRAVTVPEGYPGQVLSAPHPVGGKLYVRLRDDPQVVNEVVVSEPGRAHPLTSSATTKPPG